MAAESIVSPSTDNGEDVALAALSRVDMDLWASGYSSGYACGVDTGYARGRADERADVAAIQRVMHQAARMPVRTPAALTADPEAMRLDLLDRDRIRGEAFRHGLRAGRAVGGAA